MFPGFFSSRRMASMCVQGHTKWVTAVAWEPAHRRLPARRFVSGSQDKSVRVWDAITLQCLFR